MNILSQLFQLICDNNVYLAAKKCHLQSIKNYVYFGYDPNTSFDQHNFSPFHLAVNSSCHEVVSYMLDSGVNPFVVNYQDETPIMTAIKNNNPIMVETLLKHIDLPKNIHNKQTDLLDYSLAFGNEAVIEILLENGYKLVNPIILQDLIYTQGISIDSLKLLIKYNAISDLDGFVGNELLVKSVTINDVDVTRLLIASGVKVDIVKFEDNLLVIRAVELGNKEILEMLLKAGADPNSTKNLALVSALTHDHHELIPILLKYGADINAVDFEGKNFIHHLAILDCRELTKDAIKKGADIYHKDNSGHTPLYNAILYENDYIIEILQNAESTPLNIRYEPICYNDINYEQVKTIGNNNLVE